MLANFLHAPLNARNFSNYDHIAFSENLKKCSWDDVYSERDINSAWSKWKGVISISL